MRGTGRGFVEPCIQDLGHGRGVALASGAAGPLPWWQAGLRLRPLLCFCGIPLRGHCVYRARRLFLFSSADTKLPCKLSLFKLMRRVGLNKNIK